MVASSTAATTRSIGLAYRLFIGFDCVEPGLGIWDLPSDSNLAAAAAMELIAWLVFIALVVGVFGYTLARKKRARE